MKVRVEEFEDKSEQDDEGFYEYYYKGKCFFFEEDKTIVIVRTYDETPDEADFMSLNGCLFNAETIHHPILKQVEDHLRKMGFNKLKILFGKKGYTTYPVTER